MKPDERQQTEFLQMLSQCEGILIKVCRYFTRRRPCDFRDLYQEIVCTLWELWPTFRGESKPSTWVTRIALNVAGQEIRKRKRMPLFVEYDAAIHDILSDEATDLRYQSLYRLIDNLQDDYDRKLLFLYIDCHTLREIADITGTTEAAVKQRLYRIRQQLLEMKQQDTDYE
jgi:RNA polymerase sigma-70 factor (ECF subfamily)